MATTQNRMEIHDRERRQWRAMNAYLILKGRYPAPNGGAVGDVHMVLARSIASYVDPTGSGQVGHAELDLLFAPFLVVRVGLKWGIFEVGSDGVVRKWGVGTFWRWMTAAKIAEALVIVRQAGGWDARDQAELAAKNLPSQADYLKFVEDLRYWLADRPQDYAQAHKWFIDGLRSAPPSTVTQSVVGSQSP